MENKAQKQSTRDENESQKEANYKYDIFISYRHLSTTSDENHRHSTSLARSIAQALKNEGFNVYFDCWERQDPDGWKYIKESKYIIVLLAKYSLDGIDSHPCEAINVNASDGNGYNFLKELYEANKRLKSKSNKNKKKTVFLLNIDGLLSTSAIQQTLSKNNYKQLASQKTRIIRFPTDDLFLSSINDLIDNYLEKPEKKEVVKISEPSCKRYRVITAFAILGMLIAFVIGGFGYCRYDKHISSLKEEKGSLEQDIDSLNQIINNDFVFAGGGTVKQYIFKKYGVKLDEDYPGSKYIHMPSRDTWSLLWDDVNGCEAHQYCPIVFSTTQIDTKGANEEKLKEKIRIVEYKVGTAQLMVQVINNTDSVYQESTIYLEDLPGLLTAPNCLINTTTSSSGTYYAYKELLIKKGLNLEELINKQSKQEGGRIDFSRCYFKKNKKGDGTTILLGNEYYYNDIEEKRSDLKLVSKLDQRLSVDLYVYTIAILTAQDGDNTHFKLLQQAEQFLQRIGCNTNKKIDHNDDFVVTLGKTP